MALFFGDRIKVATSSTGTASITLGSAETGYQTFSDAGMVDTEWTRYLIEDGDDWEIGKGQLSSSGTTMTRSLTSSSTGSLLNLSGSAVVMCTPSSEDIVMWQAKWPESPTTVVVGDRAGEAAYTSGDVQTNSVFVGRNSGYSATYGDYNTFVGAWAGYNVTTASYSTYIGAQTQPVGTGAAYQVAIGYEARTGASGVSIGSWAGSQSGSANVYVGQNSGTLTSGARYYVTTAGSYNGSYTGNNFTTVGSNAMRYGGYGAESVAIGVEAMRGNGTSTSDYANIAIGYRALRYPQQAYNNVAIGPYAGEAYSNFTGYNCTSIGYVATPSSTSATNQFTLGNSSVTNLRCNDTSISTLSDERDKTDIQDLNYGLDFINDVRPVKFTWNRRDGSMGARRDIGFIAQELYDVEIDHSSASDTRLAVWLNPEKMEARPHAMFPILVKAVQELSQKCDALEARIAELEGA